MTGEASPPATEKEPRKIGGLTVGELGARALAGVLTAGLIAVSGLMFDVYNNTASHKKDIAYLLKREEQMEAALVQLDEDLRELKEEMTQSNAEFHSQAIAKINELLARDRYRVRTRER